MKHWQSLLLLSIALWPFSAWACIDESGSFGIIDILLAVLELFLAGFFLLLWWITGRFWPTEPARSDNFRFYCLFVAAATSVALGLFGTFYLSDAEHMYGSFETDLPNATQFILGNRYLLWLTFVPVAILWWLARSKAIRVYYFAVLCNIEIGIFYWGLWALYRPMFKMGGLCG